MATKIDVSELTLNPEEALLLSELIMEEEFINGPLAEDHEIETGVQWDKRIVFVGKFTDDLLAHTGCTPTEGGVLPSSEKTWEPRQMGARYTHCADDLNILVKFFGKAARMNPDFYDNIDSPAGKLLAARIGIMVRENLPVKIWFSDVNADEFAGGGNFTNGTTLGRFNIITGLWPQIRAEIGVGDTNYVQITQNANTKATQFVTPLEAYNYFQAMRRAADERLAEVTGSGRARAKFYVTRSLSEPYKEYIQNNTIENGVTSVIVDGQQRLAFDGIEIKTMYVWDRTIRADQDDVIGDQFFQPIRGLLTMPENIPIATLNDDDFGEIDAFYDRREKESILDVVFNLDAKFLEDYFAVAAY